MMWKSTLLAAFFGAASQCIISPIPEAPTFLIISIFLFLDSILGSFLLFDNSLLFATTKFFLLNSVFLLTAGVFTIFRRLYFSPLSRFPGPILAAISKLWDANEFRHGRSGLTYKKLHDQYGDIIRIGPRELSVSDADAIAKVYAGKYPRGPFYEMGAINGEFNLNTIREYKRHTPWRRIWESAFVSSEFNDYNPRVEYHISKLVKVLHGAADHVREVDCTKAMDNFVFDVKHKCAISLSDLLVMADVSFSKDGGMQDGTGDGSYLDFIHKYTHIAGVVGSLRNLSQLLAYLPEASEVKMFRLKWESLVNERQKLGGSAKRDIYRHLLGEDSETGSRFSQAELYSNANLAIIAGADTTSSTLTQTFRILAKEKAIVQKMQAEVDVIDDLTVTTTKSLPYLNGVVNEALRLCNPVPSGVQATLSPAGLQLGDIHLPGNIQIRIPVLALMTNARYFPEPQSFIPERWTGERPELLLERAAFIPFGYGVHSCVGRQLALNEMRLVIAKVVKDFDIELGESYDEGRFMSQWKDFIVVKIGDCWLKFVKREKS